MKLPGASEEFDAAREEVPPCAFPSLGCLEVRPVVKAPFYLPPVPALEAPSEQRQIRQSALEKQQGAGNSDGEETAPDSPGAPGGPSPTEDTRKSLFRGLLRRLLPRQQEPRGLDFRVGFEIPICGVPEAGQLCRSWRNAGRVQVERSDRCVSVTSWEGHKVFVWLLWPGSRASCTDAAAAAASKAATAAAASPPAEAATEGGASLHVWDAGENVMSCSFIEVFSVLVVTYDTKPPRTELLLMPSLQPPSCRGGGSKKDAAGPLDLRPLRRLLLPREDVLLQWVGGSPWGVLFLCFCVQTKDAALMLLHRDSILKHQQLALEELQSRDGEGIARAEGASQTLPPIRLAARDFSSAWLPRAPFPPSAVSAHPTLPAAVVTGFREQDKCGWTCWVPLQAMTAEKEADGDSDASDEETEPMATDQQPPARAAFGGGGAPAPVVAVLPCLDLFRSLAARQALEAMDAFLRRQANEEQQLRQGEEDELLQWRRPDVPESFYGPVFLKPRALQKETSRWLASAQEWKQAVGAASSDLADRGAANQQQDAAAAAEANQRRGELLVELQDRLSLCSEGNNEHSQLRHVALSSCGALLAMSLPSDELLLLRITHDEEQQCSSSTGSGAAPAYFEPFAFLPAPFLSHLRSRAVEMPVQQQQSAAAADSAASPREGEPHSLRKRFASDGVREQRQQEQQEQQESLEEHKIWLEEEVALLQVSRPPPSPTLAASYFAGEASELLFLLFSDGSALDVQQQQQQQQPPLEANSPTAAAAAATDSSAVGSSERMTALCAVFDLDRNSLLLSPSRQQQSIASAASCVCSTKPSWATLGGHGAPPSLPLALLSPLMCPQPFGTASSCTEDQPEETFLLLSLEAGGSGSAEHQQEGSFRLSLSSIRFGDVACFAAAAAACGKWDEAECLLQQSLCVARRAQQLAEATAATAAAAAGRSSSVEADEGEEEDVVLRRIEEEVERIEEALGAIQRARWEETGRHPRASEQDFQVTFDLHQHQFMPFPQIETTRGALSAGNNAYI